MAWCGTTRALPNPHSTFHQFLLLPQQTYTQALPKNLWLAINEDGIHIMRRRAKDPIISYSYRDVVNYSPSLRNLMIVTESLTRGTKFVFNTTQVSQGQPLAMVGKSCAP